MLGEVVGTDPDSDLAVVRVEQVPEGVEPVALGDSDHVTVGQRVVVIGNPFGQDRTVTTGIVSAIGRTIEEQRGGYSIGGAIQTDAAINPGNSGGPLLDVRGRVIGMNTAILSASGASTGVGFAVPVNLIKKVVPSLMWLPGKRVLLPWQRIEAIDWVDSAVEVGLPRATVRRHPMYEPATLGRASHDQRHP